MQHILSEKTPLIVGTVHDAAGLRFLKSPRARVESLGRSVDLLEVRLDALYGKKLPSCWQLPVIATARHPGEGGSNGLSSVARRGLLEDALPWAVAVDVELRSVRPMGSVIAAAHQHGKTVILSHHDFAATPTVSSLKGLASRAADAGADIFKVAALIREPSDLQRLIEFQAGARNLPVAAMGMGPAGRFSRIVLCGFGSPFCYGWLGRPQVSGQWPALELRGLLSGILPS